MSLAERRALFVSWIGFHGRSAGIAKALGIRSEFITGGTGPAPLRYLRAWRETARLLKRERPSTVIVMQPPIVALLCVAFRTPRSVRIIGDLHTGVFTNPKWKWALALTMRILRRRGSAVVTGAALAERTRAYGVDVLELHDIIDEPIVVSDALDDPKLATVLEREYVLVPLAYSFDEPVDALLTAAEAAPEVNWVLTGRAPEHVVTRAPENVVFPGFVSRDDYRRLVKSATVMAALTTQEDTMQRVGYEALGEGKALVTSSTAVLREFFADAALYVTPDALSIEKQVREAVRTAQLLRQRMIARRAELEQTQQTQLAALAAVAS